MKTNKILLFAIILFIGVVLKTNGQTWNINGNSGILPANFLGTTDINVPLKFRIHNLKSGEINRFFTSFGYNTGTSGYSVYIGSAAGSNTTPFTSDTGTQLFNTYVGHQSGEGTGVSTGNNNSFFGVTTGNRITTGSSNVFVGSLSGYKNTTGSFNTFLGANFAVPPNDITGQYNTFIGYNCGLSITSGNRNTFLGHNSGLSLTTGSGNVFLGTVTVADAALSNTIIIGDGNVDGLNNQRLYIHGGGVAGSGGAGTGTGAGNTGIGLGNNVIPQNKLEVKHGTNGNSGLRLTSLPSSSMSSTNQTSKVLTVNTFGDVILVDDKIGTGGNGITSSCNQIGFVPVTTSTLGALSCSQIYDNGTSVGIGYSTAAIATTAFSDTGALPGTWTAPGTTPAPGIGVVVKYKLAINGLTKATAFYSTSDKKFKKDIKPIENALKTIEAIDGKTYLWNKEANKDMNFDDGGHSGFIAQELEKVLPHLVATGSNGDKAVNYIELLPYLVEGMKEQQKMINDQQTQIEELKGQITNNFRSQNQDLIQFENTKIISVSPNPSNDVISVSINVEKLVQTATLNVYDLNGKLLNNLIINERATNIIKTLQKDNFGKGIYIVSLTVNGKSIDSKKIIFN